MVLDPFISVLLPAYNAEKFIKESIDSILCQTYSNFELIIVNHERNKEAENLVLSIDDDRFIYISKNTKNNTNKNIRKESFLIS